MIPSPLLQQGWNIVDEIPQDGGLRSYTRLKKGKSSALYMDCGPLEGVPHITRLSDFVKIGGWLRDIGLRAPEIYESYPDINAALIEDFGTVSLKQSMENGADRAQLYGLCADILQVMQAQPCPLPLPNYKDSFMRQARRRFVDWYVPVVRGAANPIGLADDYEAMWNEVEAQLDPYTPSFMHVDFHVENLMYLSGAGLNAIGIIDFQEGMIGPSSYDLVNIMEDMRADVPQDIQARMTAGLDENTLGWYRVLGTQFHTRLLGQCLRWAFVEDKAGYMAYYPRLLENTKRTLDHPVLRPFKAWLKEENVDLLDPRELDWRSAKKYISKDAI